MKIIILTQYFPPEIGAPQNRLFELALRLKKSGVEVTVLTAMPNYPKMVIAEGYNGKWRVNEEMEGIKIIRGWIFVPKSRSIFPRLLNYFSFVFSSFMIGTARLKKADWLICESPPLFLGITAYFLSRFKRAKLIFNVSDLWPESAEKLGLVKNKFLLRLSTILEKFMYRKSTLVTGQTQGIVDNIQNRFPEKSVYWLPNGVDTSFYKPSSANNTWRERNNFSHEDFIFFYAGIIGHAQGLEVILKSAEILKGNSKAKFILLGEGPEKSVLLKLKEELKLGNVFFMNAVGKREMPEIIAAINVAIIPLKKLDLFKGAIPSKIFENLAMEKPILLGVEGEAKALFIEEGKSGIFFEPENAVSLAEGAKQFLENCDFALQLGRNGRKYVSEKFERAKIADDFKQLLENFANK